MLESPDAVLIYMPLMKELGMSWNEIKRTSRHELRALCTALYEYKAYHSMDGYTAEDISGMAKNKPQVRQQYNTYLQTRRKYDIMIGNEKKPTGFGNIK
tara:strand:+ start:986 stop:1282 length:297 start_codon:yes stop_codon:yes gene_type:complete